MCLFWCKKFQQVTLVFCCPPENKRDIRNVSCPLPQWFFLKGSCGFSRGLPPPPQMKSLLSILKITFKLCQAQTLLLTSVIKDLIYCSVMLMNWCLRSAWLETRSSMPKKMGDCHWGCFSLATSLGGAWMMSLEQTCNLWKWLKVMERIHPVGWPHCNFGGLGRLKLIIGIVLAQAVAALGID